MPAASLFEIFAAFFKLGLTSFGGPAAHIGYFRRAFVTDRGWLTEAEFAERLALCQFAPGPASSQLGFLIGLHRGGAGGAIMAFLGFTLPSFVLMTLAGVWALTYGVTEAGALGGVIAGLKLVAFAVVAQAIWGMGQALCPDAERRGLAAVAALALIWVAAPILQAGVIAAGAGIGALLLARSPAPLAPTAPPRPAWGLLALMILLILALIALPFARPYLQAGALVFGGGHVVLPLLDGVLGERIAPAGFLAGYGLAQAMPGPLFTFASYLGALQDGFVGALIATAAIFVTGFALVLVALPLWGRIAARPIARGAVAGANAAVVGVLLATWLTALVPVALMDLRHGLIGAALLALAFTPRVPPVAIVLAGGIAGAALL